MFLYTSTSPLLVLGTFTAVKWTGAGIEAEFVVIGHQAEALLGYDATS